MRVAFLGTPDFAVPTLDALVAAGHEVVLVVAQPDRPAGRGQQLTSPPVAARAKALGLPLAQPKALRSGPFPERFLSLGLDVAVVVAYGRILPKALLDGPRHGCVNVHASLLPRWRGAAPIQHAILAGDALTGVCTQRMEETLDTGPLWASIETAIGPHETAGQLHDRLSAMAAEVAVHTLTLLATGAPVPQDEEGATYAGKIEKEHGRLDLRGSAVELDRRARAMTPWPGGWIATADGPIKVLEERPADGAGAPGTVLSTSPLVVACGEGALELARVQLPGRRPVSGADAANGLRLKVGDRFPGTEEG
ncbi:MAG: methionyl-tRNA formyltransferase [Alphaproteobacteria bacterium]|nr:methionyl-tRNA formyltransferase [Alphaproteobacteria bacterium]MCB9697160.1 methionyl-tRNA formyltransferase [Alphaproteobacteria bacterium]